MITTPKKITRAEILKAKRFRFLVVPFVLLTSSFSFAASLEITAKFNPDAQNPLKNSFINTTPISGLCAQHPVNCRDGHYTIIIPGLSTNAASIKANHADRRQGAMFIAPAEWRTVEVKGPKGVPSELEFRISGFGATKEFSPDVNTITGVTAGGQAPHNALWIGRDWIYPAAPCGYTGMGLYGSNYYAFFWLTPSIATCGKTALFDIQSFKLDRMQIMYELRTPDALSMRTGTYTGEITYSVGPGGDLDFGDLIIPTENTLTINFQLTVEHILNVRLPVGSERLALVPSGGWQQWLNRGRPPEKLFVNQNFQIGASTPFKMMLQCQHAIGNQCGIQNKDGHSVPVETRVTLPSGMRSETNTPVNRQLLTTEPSNFHPTYYVDNGQAALHFDVGRDSVEEMTHHAGKQYSGNVTVIWDPEI